jgi:lipoprotein-anchoring transpeptidase ErfK/SrfK
VLSPDLTDPWLLQLKAGKKRPVLSLPGVTRNVLFAPPTIDVPAPRPPAQQVVLRIPGASDAVVNYRLDPEFLPKVIAYPSDEKPGTIIIDTEARHLYLIMGEGRALRYGVGVGRPGFEWAGVRYVTRMAEWPDWTPPVEMLARKPGLPRHMDGGPDNPLGARALYLGSTLYRIHGSNEPWTIGHAVSSGCIRMRNEDVSDLYQRVSVGAKVIVL